MLIIYLKGGDLVDKDEKIKKLEERAEKMKNAGAKMDKLGTKLTFTLTFPIVGYLLFGFYGLLGGILIGVIGLVLFK